MEHKKTISKSDLADFLGVSIPTVYAMIDRNQDGIKDYCTGKRIDSAIKDKEPFKSLSERHRANQEQTIADKSRKSAAERAKLQEQIDTQAAKITDLEQTIAAKDQTIKDQAARITDMERTITDLEHQRDLADRDKAHQEQTIADLRKELETAHQLHALTLAALPAPRKTIVERLKALFTRAKQPENDA